MKSNVKQINPLVELIKNRAAKLGIITNKDISKYTKVPEPNLSRFFRGGGIHSDHIYALLDKFDLLITSNSKNKKIISLYEQIADANQKLAAALTEINRLKTQLFKQSRKDDPPNINVVKLRKKK